MRGHIQNYFPPRRQGAKKILREPWINTMDADRRDRKKDFATEGTEGDITAIAMTLHRRGAG